MSFFLNKPGSNNGGGGGTPVSIVDNLTSNSKTSALSANQGRVLNEKITEHEKAIASTDKLGHVKVDGSTITIDPVTGVISSTATGGDSVAYAQAILPTTVINQTKWKIPFSNYKHPDDLLIVTFNSVVVNTDNYSITQNDDGISWDVNIPMSPTNTRPIDTTKVFVIMVKGGSSVGSGGEGYSVNVEDILSSTSSVSALSANMGRELKSLHDNHKEGKASKTTFGHVQVGEGLTVSNGIVSLERTTNSNFEIDTPPSQYPLGVTEIPIQTINDSKYYADLRIVLNTLLGFHQGEGLYYRYYVKITKRSDSSVRQEVSVTSNIVGSEGYKMFDLERETNLSNGSFYPWRASLNTMVGRGEPENVIPAMRGCLYFDCSHGKLYRKNTGISDTPSTGWSVISS